MLDLVNVLDMTVDVGRENTPLSITHADQQHTVVVEKTRISNITKTELPSSTVLKGSTSQARRGRPRPVVGQRKACFRYRCRLARPEMPRSPNPERKAEGDGQEQRLP